MPKQFDACVMCLTEAGHDQGRAARACQAAFWQEHGVTVGVALAAGFEPEGDLTEHAALVAAELADQGDEGDSVFVLGGRLKPVSSEDEEACLSAYDGVQKTNEQSLLTESEVLEPGVYNGHEFTPAYLAAVARNYDPSKPPPIVKDHKLDDADACYGRVRGLRYDAENEKLLSLSEFLGSHAIERVKDGRWTQLSGRFLMRSQRMTELSVTLNPAYTGSRIKSKSEVARMSKQTQAKLSKEEAPEGTAAPAPDPTPQAPAANEVTLEKSPRELEVEAKLAEAEAKLAEVNAREAKREEEIKLRRQREDEKDWELLLAQGYAEPRTKEKELAFMGRLDEDEKEEFLSLRRDFGKIREYGRKSTADVPDAPVSEPEAQLSEKQDALMGVMRAAAGIPQPSTNGQAAK